MPVIHCADCKHVLELVTEECDAYFVCIITLPPHLEGLVKESDRQVDPASSCSFAIRNGQ